MARRFLLTCVLLMAPTAAQAQTLEKLLPAGSQIYCRWDGIDAHRAAFDQTAVGKMAKGDTGKFLGALWDYGADLAELAMDQADPKALALFKSFPKLLNGIAQHGFLVGIEVGSVNPPDIEAVLVFPRSGGEQGTLLPFVSKLTAMTQAEVTKTRVGSRLVYSLGNDKIHLGWWIEPDDDVVLVFGTRQPAALAKAIAAGQGGFADSVTFKKLAAFKEFPTWGKTHLDLEGLLKKIGDLAPQADKLIGELGLKSLKGVTMYSGFDGPAERSLIEVDITGQRKGLLALINRKTFTLADLPPMPNDVTSFTASNFNVKNLYDGGVAVAESAVKVFAPDNPVDVKEMIRGVEALIQIKFGEDLFGNFDDLFLSYSASSEGPLGMGGVYVLKVKDEKKLAAAIEAVVKAIPPFPVEVGLKKRKYHGAELMELQMKTEQGEFALGSMTIHKGWFVFSSLPQPIYGFILRTKGDLPVWKADAKLAKSLAAFPQEFTAIAVSDPRPTVQFLLSLAPTAMNLANSFLPQALPGARAFEIGVIPHAQEATRHLFPNISVTTDDGKKIRTETRASLALPF